MNPAFDELEAELAAMRPRPLSPALLEGIEGGMAESSAPSSARSSRWPDRFLLCAIASGAMAACVIVSILLQPSNQAFPSPPPVLAMPASAPPRAGDYSLVVARADSAWVDELRFGP